MKKRKILGITDQSDWKIFNIEDFADFRLTSESFKFLPLSEFSEPLRVDLAPLNPFSSEPHGSGIFGTALESLKSRPLSLNRGDKNQSPSKRKRRGKAQNR
jgi:hypothetical protein